MAAEADARVRAAEQAAARAIADAEERVRAVQQDREAAEERLTAAEQAAEQQASTASSALGVLRRELEGAREALAEAQGQLAALHGERQAGMRHLEGLREQLRRAGEEAARWRQVAAPRTRQRLVLEARWALPYAHDRGCARSLTALGVSKASPLLATYHDTLQRLNTDYGTVAPARRLAPAESACYAGSAPTSGHSCPRRRSVQSRPPPRRRPEAASGYRSPSQLTSPALHT